MKLQGIDQASGKEGEQRVDENIEALAQVVAGLDDIPAAVGGSGLHI